MARLAVLTDRLPTDTSLKGAYTWEIIRSLCESQHEVAVFTTQNPEEIPLTHSRLTVAQPAPTFTADRLPRWTQALITYRPEVIHTFPLQTAALWPSLTVWPYLDAFCKVMPGWKRISTMFDAHDFAAAAAWHAGSDSWTVFSPELENQARAKFQGRVDLVPLEDITLPDPGEHSESGFVFVPAPVSEWHKPDVGLAMLADYLVHNPSAEVQINGGWGDLSLSERRRGWTLLSNVAARVRLTEPQSLNGFVTRARAASRMWLENLSPQSWRYILAAQIARNLGKEVVGPAAPLALPSGSTANFLSRLYLS